MSNEPTTEIKEDYLKYRTLASEMKRSTTANILGTEYNIVIATEKDYPMLKEVDGYTDTSIKLIVVDACNEVTPDSKKDLEMYRKSVIRHEIIHAFLYESGLAENSGSAQAWATNEEMVDWFAIQAPKIMRIFESVDCAY